MAYSGSLELWASLTGDPVGFSSFAVRRLRDDFGDGTWWPAGTGGYWLLL